jgi:hypothetical protein
VTFPPGRARLATSPALTGSTLLVMTIGMVVVAFMAVAVFGLNPATSEKWHPTASVIDQARCLSWVKLRRTQCEQMSSGLPLKADIAQCSRHVSNVPQCMARAVRCKTEAPRPTNVRAATMYQASNVEHLLRAIMGTDPGVIGKRGF